MELKGSKNSPYKKGRNFEYRVKAKFQKAGYYCIRSAGSKGAADLIAYGNGKVLFIQCKLGKYASTTEWNELYKLCKELGVIPIWAYSENRKTYIMEMTSEKNKRGLMPMVEFDLGGKNA